MYSLKNREIPKFIEIWKKLPERKDKFQLLVLFTIGCPLP